jgi:hypothetical protein
MTYDAKTINDLPRKDSFENIRMIQTMTDIIKSIEFKP